MFTPSISGLIKPIFKPQTIPNWQPNKAAPKSKLTGKPVIHFAHANGMPSAVYQPLFDVLKSTYTIEYIPYLGTHPDYPVDDHWQSLTQQVIDSVAQTCKKHGVSQVIALGHSLGALCSLQAIYKEPQLFYQALLLDPPLMYGKISLLWHIAKQIDKLPALNQPLTDKLSPAGLSKHRRDIWDSKQQACQQLKDKTFFKDFEPRCFEGYMKHGLSVRADGKVTLSIPKAVEVAVFRTNPSWYWLTPNQPPNVPVKLIIGQDSLFLKKRFPQKIKARLGIEFVIHQGGHMFPLEYPDSVANTIKQLLEADIQSDD